MWTESVYELETYSHFTDLQLILTLTPGTNLAISILFTYKLALIQLIVILIN